MQEGPRRAKKQGAHFSAVDRWHAAASEFEHLFGAIFDRRLLWLAALALLSVIAVAAASLVLSWVWSATPVQYVTAPVSRGAVTRTVTASGTVNPLLTVIVGTYVSGVIQDVQCDFNTKVTKGQLCAKIDPRPYQAIVDQNRALLAMAKAQLDKDKAALAYAKVTFERNGALVKTNAVSKDVFDQSQAGFDQARAQVQLDEATIEQRQAELSAAEVNLGYTDIASPVNGTVVSRNVTRGQTVAASLQTPTLFLIAEDLTKMEVDTNVSESDIGGVKEGQKASFTVESYTEHPFVGVVTQVRQAPQTVQNVVTYDVVVTVDNLELRLKPGMTATTKIVIDQRDNVVRVPSQALRYAPGGLAAAQPAQRRKGTTQETAHVWLLRDGAPVRVDVKAGLDDDTRVELLAGEVKVGDAVIVAEQAPGVAAGAKPHF